MRKYLIVEDMIELRVYESVTGLRRSYRRLFGNRERTVAAVCPVEQYITKGGKVKKTPLCAEIWVSKDIELPVLSHECIHAATVLSRKLKWRFSIGRKIGFEEERFCYLHTLILQEVLKHIKSRKNSNYRIKIEEIPKWAK